jgi:WD40 repeat protein
MRCGLRGLVAAAVVMNVIAGGAAAQSFFDPRNERKPVRILEGHEVGVTVLAFSPDGKTLASGSGESVIKLWDPETGKERRTLEAHTSPVMHLVYSRDGAFLLSAEWGKRAVVWNAKTLEIEQVWTLPWVPQGAGFTEKGQVVIAGGEEMRVYDVARESAVRTIPVEHVVRSMAVSADGKVAAVGNDDGHVRVWDIATGENLAELNVGTAATPVGQVPEAAGRPDVSVGLVAFVDDHRLAVGSATAVLWTWRDPERGRKRLLGSVHCAAVFGSLLILAGGSQIGASDVSQERPQDWSWMTIIPGTLRAAAASADYVAVAGGAAWNPNGTMRNVSATGIQVYRTEDVRANIQAVHDGREAVWQQVLERQRQATRPQ